MAPVSNGEEPKKLETLTVPKIIEQLELALIDIKYNKPNDDELVFNNTENVPINSKNFERPQFIGKEMMLFEMIGILNGKITELQKKYDKIKNIEEREEQFLASKSDEITKPIEDIFDIAKQSKLGKINPNDVLDGVLDAAKKLQNISTVVLDTNRITNKCLILTKKNQSINEIISECIELLQNSNLKVPIRVGLDNDIEIPVDKMRIIQVIHTILKNAGKYTETGQIKVESFVAHEQSLVIIRINDTGKGISKDILPKIFEQATTENQVNDGKLSLFLCKGIIESHDGKIIVKNNSDKGCTFTVSLPIKN